MKMINKGLKLTLIIKTMLELFVFVVGMFICNENTVLLVLFFFFACIGVMFIFALIGEDLKEKEGNEK